MKHKDVTLTPYEQGYQARLRGINASPVGFAIMATDYLGLEQAALSDNYPMMRDRLFGFMDAHYDLAAEMS